MKTLLRPTSILAALTLVSSLSPQLAAAPLGTAFTYQGRLQAGGSVANGVYDLRFEIYDTLTNGSLVSSVLTNVATPVANGLFTVTLDFGDGRYQRP